ncbi:MAG: MarR family winged helix-turn-helix transcriptional regulator [Arcobacter sp.]|jgi:DNA-binding MarR family transcriptional regulator|uniref:MarR family winged helix-turn-helix transcriptional regulator n=1 Tax=unclassified Arcobacter TaxID=2593671 RepID=UPI000229661F|nr:MULTISPECIES: MarR family transcriptional regulator [unclassified Arcobacter]MDY3201693.1 MarR family transcriptional regulator [Arcobacter sp.]BAK74444.1 MarR family transcriptional regulator [Arcobacter sp. L]
MNFTLSDQLGIKIAKVRNSIKNEMEIALSPYELTTTQFVVLLKLCEKDRMTQKDLANETDYKQSALTLILDKLEAKGLVNRESKKNDRRAYLIAITNKGKELKDILINLSLELEKKVLQGISETEKDVFISMLDKIMENLSKE